MARRARFYYQSIALAGRDLPVPCDECGEDVVDFHGGNSGVAESGEVHHIDEDPENNDVSNLMILHHGCHTRIHFAGQPKSESHREALSRAWTDERRALQLEINRRVWTGRKHRLETKLKMRTPRRRVRCSDCGREYAVNWINRHVDEGKCVR